MHAERNIELHAFFEEGIIALSTIARRPGVVRGYFNYHAVPGNMDSLNSFRGQVIWRWYRALRRRSQRDRMTWERFWPLVDRWIPSAKILHPHPNVRIDARYLR